MADKPKPPQPDDEPEAPAEPLLPPDYATHGDASGVHGAKRGPNDHDT